MTSGQPGSDRCNICLTPHPPAETVVVPMPEKSQLDSGELSQLCYIVGELGGKVDLLVNKISETMGNLVTERSRIDNIDRRLAAFSVMGPILAVAVPSIISVALAVMMRPPSDRGLTGAEVMMIRQELEYLQQLKKQRMQEGHLGDKDNGLSLPQSN